MFNIVCNLYVKYLLISNKEYVHYSDYRRIKIFSLPNSLYFFIGSQKSFRWFRFVSFRFRLLNIQWHIFHVQDKRKFNNILKTIQKWSAIDKLKQASLYGVNCEGSQCVNPQSCWVPRRPKRGILSMERCPVKIQKQPMNHIRYRRGEVSTL